MTVTERLSPRAIAAFPSPFFPTTGSCFAPTARAVSRPDSQIKPDVTLRGFFSCNGFPPHLSSMCHAGEQPLGLTWRSACCPPSQPWEGLGREAGGAPRGGGREPGGFRLQQASSDQAPWPVSSPQRQPNASPATTWGTLQLACACSLRDLRGSASEPVSQPLASGQRCCPSC